MDISQACLAYKVILEVGSGRGDTTRQLVRCAAGQPGVSLIVTDVSNAHFASLQSELCGMGVPLAFLCTGACELAGIVNDSVDYLVCDYTLCAVEAQAGCGALALRRFWEVLKPGGCLFVAEEYPIMMARTAAQSVWAEKWRILKTMTLLTGGLPYVEFAPDTLAALCRLAGFIEVQWKALNTLDTNPDALDFFFKRMNRLLAQMKDDSLRVGFAALASQLQTGFSEVGGMETPAYELTARKCVTANQRDGE
jgi:SAM-dependent methyltransferase